MPSDLLLKSERAVAGDTQPDICWHCHDVLEPTERPHCTSCPPECDVEGCEAPGCMGETLPEFDGSGLECEGCAKLQGMNSMPVDLAVARFGESLSAEVDAKNAAVNRLPTWAKPVMRAVLDWYEHGEGPGPSECLEETWQALTHEQREEIERDD